MSERFAELVKFDAMQREPNVQYLIGVDEAGRGCLAGPMFAAAVILKTGTGLEAVDDSKRVRTHEQRTSIEARIQASAFAWGVATVSAREIDSRGLDWANRIVFTRAIRALEIDSTLCTTENTLVLVDGVRPPYRCPFPHRMIKGGDRQSLAIAAASILAKTARDRYCIEVMHEQYPDYGFDRHKGYATAAHYAALEVTGPSPLHRHSFTLTRTS